MSDAILPIAVDSLRVRTFSFYIYDGRYSAPTLKLSPAMDEGDARRQAQLWLDESDHHHAIEVFEDDQLAFRIP